MNSTRAQLKTALKDLEKIFRGSVALLRYCCRKDNIPVAISLFSTESFSVIPGTTSRYELHMVNDTDFSSAVNLLLDIYAKDLQVHPDGHYAYYTKQVVLHAHESKCVVINYNWRDSFAICIDGESHLPDSSWRGTCRKTGAYIIHAILLNDQNQRLDGLSIVQQLLP